MDGRPVRPRRPRSDAQQRRQRAWELMGSPLTDAEIARVLGVDERTIRRYRVQGKAIIAHLDSRPIAS
jgi:DNA-binding CsgD family transcriptional regulator